MASFGKGSEQVTNLSYYNALDLDADQFLTSFSPYGVPVIDTIIDTMVPDVRFIKSELYKLNIYAEGGFFKTHVDTPRSGQMFGSLVRTSHMMVQL